MTESEATEIPVREGDILAGKYLVERVIGIGGMGVVVAATHTELDQKFAIKVLMPSAAQNPAVIARFSREARAAAKIKSEHVVRVSDVGNLANGLPYIVMEYLDGEDLSQLLTRETRLSPGVAVDYVLQAVEALAEAHAAGFVHRDLKPGNLFLARRADGSAIIKVLDFGISKAAIGDAEPASSKPGSLTRTSDVFGSPLYMSPEQLKSARDVDARADVWALGVILYELISGKPPFDRGTIAETFGAILYEKPESLTKVAGVSADLDKAVLKCLEKDVAIRYQNVAEVAKALFPFAEQATRQSIERTSRVLKRAGMNVDTLPPVRAAKASTNLSPGGSTRTSWGATDGAESPRSGRAAILAGAGLSVVLGAALLFAFNRYAPRGPVSAKPAPDAPKVVSVDSASPTPGPSVTPSIAPSIALPPLPSASAAPSNAPSATNAPSASPGPAAPPPKAGAPKPPPSPVTAAPPPPVTVAPVAPPSPPPAPKTREDPNGFGDRK